MISRIRSLRARPFPPRVLVVLTIWVVVGLLVFGAYQLFTKEPTVHDFRSCADAGNPIMESYPEQCVHQGQSYINPAQKVPDPFEEQKKETK